MTLSLQKTIIDSFALNKVLLIVFFHHNALLLLPHIASAGFRGASFSCLSSGLYGVYCHGLHYLYSIGAKKRFTIVGKYATSEPPTSCWLRNGCVVALAIVY